MSASPTLLDRLPSRTDPRGTGPLRVLFDGTGTPLQGDSRGGLVDELARRYDGDLRLALRDDRPTMIANFVETIDGVVAMTTDGHTGGGEVSGFSPADRFVMGLLRSLADVVLVGASSIRTSQRATRTPAGVFPDAAAAFADLRSRLGLAPAPTTLVVTSSGDLDPGMPAFRDQAGPVVIAAPAHRVAELRARGFAPTVGFEPLRGSAATPDELVEVTRRLGARVVVTEAGPRIFADLAGAGLIDELFLTLAPQLAGRDPSHPRLPLVDGAAFFPDSPRWARLASVRAAGDHLFLRYQLEDQPA
jgi:riboflavin biosynthesis pyrimidine reductase